jgi:cation transport protein ChaC
MNPPASNLRPPGALWVFAYGSLLWNPACDVAEVRGAVVQGWHRSFCFRAGRLRASPDRPGLMLALDRGGQCRGMVFRLADEQVEESLEKHFRRELVTKPAVYVPRWLTARTSEGPVVARMLATAAGPRGSCAEYLHNTVAHLEELGIRDRNLWHLQKLVAERIAKAHRS